MEKNSKRHNSSDLKNTHFNMSRLSSLILLTTLFFISAANAERLKVGVTLQPYYSWVKNIVGDKADVIPVIKAGNNVHSYVPRPEDIERLIGLSVLVVNGVGHDEFAFKMLKAAALDNKKLPLIYANEGVALTPVGGSSGAKVFNSHTFVSISVSIQQIYKIAEGLGKLDKANSELYRVNARNYAKRLRKMKAGFMQKLMNVKSLDLKCATIHGGYDYLLHEFGISVVAVIEPAHGVAPTANQLAKTIEKIKKLNVDVIFTEMNFGPKYISVIAKETGVKVKKLSHLTSGEYSATNFEDGMRENMQTVVDAIMEN